MNDSKRFLIGTILHIEEDLIQICLDNPFCQRLQCLDDRDKASPFGSDNIFFFLRHNQNHLSLYLTQTSSW